MLNEIGKAGEITQAVMGAQSLFGDIVGVSETILKKLSPVLSPDVPKPEETKKVELSQIPLLKEVEILKRQLLGFHSVLVDVRERINI